MARSGYAKYIGRQGLPVISPRAVEHYLNRPLVSFDFLKDVSEAELKKEIYRLGHRFTGDPWHNQLTCFLIGTQQPAFLFYLKMGGGKSNLMLQLLRYRKKLQHLKCGLVMVPQLVHVESWEEQIQEHAPDLQYRLLVGSAKERAKQLSRSADVYVSTYAGLQTQMTARKADKRRRRNRQVIDKDAAAAFASRFNFAVYDEVHRIVNAGAITADMFYWISYACDFKYALTGTPVGKNIIPLFSQFKLIDGGETFGENIGMFKAAFFTPKESYWSGIDWKFNNAMMPTLTRMKKHRSITYELRELRDVPTKLLIRLPTHLRGEGLLYYQRIVKKLAEARGDYRSLNNIFVRLRQCASGFISLRADDESRLEIEFKDNPKIERLKEFINSKDEKMLVFHEFRTSARYIETMMEQQKIKFASLRGGLKDTGAYRRFLDEPSCKIFLLNNQLGSEAINPQYVCRRAIVYESPVGAKAREQMEARVERPGQRWMTFIHDLVVKGTVEETILKSNREGLNVLDALFSGDISALVEDDE